MGSEFQLLPESSAPGPVVRALRTYSVRSILSLCILCLLAPSLLFASNAPRHFPITLQPDDVIPAGDEWIVLPTIRAGDGALTSFNVLSMRYRGLLQVAGAQGAPVIQPYFEVAGKRVPFRDPAWDLIEYWIPTTHLTADGLSGSYRMPFTTSWSVADHLSLKEGRAQALKVLRASQVGWRNHHGRR